jgi:hypothetical protein
MNSLLRRGLELTEDEAYALLGLCLTSPGRFDDTAKEAMLKLAEYCSQRSEVVHSQLAIIESATA